MLSPDIFRGNSGEGLVGQVPVRAVSREELRDPNSETYRSFSEQSNAFATFLQDVARDNQIAGIGGGHLDVSNLSIAFIIEGRILDEENKDVLDRTHKASSKLERELGLHRGEIGFNYTFAVGRSFEEMIEHIIHPVQSPDEEAEFQELCDAIGLENKDPDFAGFIKFE
ncbi:MAG TPA: hypothetical protein VLF68_03910 [Candidatus Saccharimonadales bacterium]|nr:hypothetical protein [Candidatus Saccharimonadales bacterium]